MSVTLSSSTAMASSLMKMINLRHVGEASSMMLSYADKTIQVYGEGKNIWFAGLQAASLLEYKNGERALTKHVAKDRKTSLAEIYAKIGPTQIMGGPPSHNEGLAVYISDAGFFQFLFNSAMPLAAQFQSWVYDEVLPSIRRTGGYILGQRVQELETSLMNQRLLLDKTIEDSKRDLHHAELKLKMREAMEAKYKRQIARQQAREDAFKQRAAAYKMRAKELRLANSEAAIKLNNIYTHAKGMISCKPIAGEDEMIYILSTESYAHQGVFKVGETQNMDLRTPGHNNTRVGPDKVAILASFKVHDAKLVEKYIHKRLEPFLISGTREFFHLPYRTLYDIVNKIIAFDNSLNGIVNANVKQVNDLHTHLIAAPDWFLGLEDKKFPDERKKKITVQGFDASLTDTDARREVCQQVLSGYMTILLESDFNIAGDVELWFENIKVSEKELTSYFKSNIMYGQKTKFKPTEWLTELRTTASIYPYIELVP